jgi:transcriptional antiterminator NusG
MSDDKNPTPETTEPAPEPTSAPTAATPESTAAATPDSAPGETSAATPDSPTGGISISSSPQDGGAAEPVAASAEPAEPLGASSQPAEPGAVVVVPVEPVADTTEPVESVLASSAESRAGPIETPQTVTHESVSEAIPTVGPTAVAGVEPPTASHFPASEVTETGSGTATAPESATSGGLPSASTVEPAAPTPHAEAATGSPRARSTSRKSRSSSKKTVTEPQSGAAAGDSRENLPTPAEPTPGPPVEAEATSEPATEPPSEQPPENKKKWYAVKVQSGREESIKLAIERKVRIEGLERYFGQIVIPVEEINEKKKVKVRVKNKATGEIESHTQEKNVVKKQKKYPGYIFAEVEFNDEILYLFRETPGVGDFVGITAKKSSSGGLERSPPLPMTDREVQSMLTGVPNLERGKTGRAVKTVVKLDFEKGDKVRIKKGAFAGQEGEVKAIVEAKDPADSPKVTVEVTFWGRPVPVELDYWEVDKV